MSSLVNTEAVTLLQYEQTQAIRTKTPDSHQIEFNGYLKRNSSKRQQIKKLQLNILA